MPVIASSAGAPEPEHTAPRPLQDLEDEICSLAAQIASITGRWLLLLAEFDAREGWAGYGMISCAHWLNLRCGLSLGAAREHLRTARALVALPAMSEAFEAGQLSYSKVRALTRVATPVDDSELTTMARACTASQVERTVRAYRRAQDPDAPAPSAPDLYVRWEWDEDGCLVARMRIGPEDGARLVELLEHARDELRDQRRGQAAGRVGAQDGVRDAEPDPEDVPAGTSAGGDDHRSAGDRQPGDDPHGERGEHCLEAEDAGPRVSLLDAVNHLTHRLLDSAPSPVMVGDRCQVVVHVDTATLANDRSALGHLEDGPALAPETLRRLACDAAVVAMLRGPRGEVLDVGRRTRQIPPAIARALRVRDKGCRFPGCTAKRRLHAHHIRFWGFGGPTKLSNLVLLCEAHHKAVHEGGFKIAVIGPQQFRFLGPSWQTLPEGPTAVERCADPLPDLEPSALFPQWAGGPFDLDDAITALLSVHRSSAESGMDVAA